MKSLKIALINPPVYKVVEPWYDTPDFVRTALACLAGYLEKHSNYEILLIDAKFERLNFNQVISRLEDFNPDIVGLTAFTNEIKPAAYQAGLIKQHFPDCITVIGGAHATAIPKQTLEEFPVFDFVAIGEGEKTLLELCRAIDLNLDFSKVDGIAYRLNNNIHITSMRVRQADMDVYPMPAWNMLPKAKTYHIQSSRGCPYNCTFCMNHNGKLVRLRSIEHVMDEINFLINEMHAETISFGDEIFSVNIPRTHQLLDAFIHQKIGEQVNWDVQTHVKYVNDELFKKFKLANVEIVELGVETGNDELLSKMGKGTNLPLILKAFKSARKHGVKSGSFFLFGQPNETIKSLWQTIKFAVKLNPDQPMFGIMVPYPGTKVAKLAANNECGYRLESYDWNTYNKQIGNALSFANLSRRKIEFMQLFAYLTVYILNFRFIDFANFLFKYWKGGIIALAQIFKFKRKDNSLVKDPSDYSAVVNATNKITKEQMIDSTDNWMEYQKEQMSIARKSLKPS